MKEVRSQKSEAKISITQGESEQSIRYYSLKNKKNGSFLNAG